MFGVPLGGPDGVSPPDGICGCAGIHDLPLACRVVWSITCVAVAVVPDFVAVTLTVSPDLHAGDPDSPPFTLVDESTVNVPDVPSALFTTSVHVLPDVSVTDDTVPVRTSIVS